MVDLTQLEFGRVAASAGASVFANLAYGRPTARVWASSVDRVQRMSELSPVEFTPGENPESDASVVTLTVNPERSYQSMLGPGSSLEPATRWNPSRLDPSQRAHVVARLVSPTPDNGLLHLLPGFGTASFYVNPRRGVEPLIWGGNDHDVGEAGIIFRHWDD